MAAFDFPFTVSGMASEAKLAFFDMGDFQGNLYIPTDLEGGVFKWAYEVLGSARGMYVNTRRV